MALDGRSDFAHELTQSCCALNANSDLGTARVQPGAGGRGLFSAAGEKEIHARSRKIGFGLNFELGFSLFGGRQCTQRTIF